MRSTILVGLSLVSISAWAFNFSAIVPTPDGGKSRTVASSHDEPASAKTVGHGHEAMAKHQPSPAHVEKREAPATFEYTVLKDETAWFLSTVFYGKGQEYPRILSSNGLEKPEQIKEGMVLKIEGAQFWSTQAGFQERYADLLAKRSEALEKKKNAANDEDHKENRTPASTNVGHAEGEVMIPVQKIRGKDSVSSLPFSSVVDSKSSPSELAKGELFQRKTRKANPESGH